MDSNSFMHFVEYELQAIALSWMVIIYTIKAVQLSKLPMPWEKEKILALLSIPNT